MEEKFIETYDDLLRFEQRIERLVDYLYDVKKDDSKSLDKEEMFSEVANLLERCIDIRTELTENFCTDSKDKEMLLANMQAKKQTLIETRQKNI